MSEHTARIVWSLGEGEAFTSNRYSRAHHWHFDGGVEVPASSSPLSVPVPMSDASAVDPEEALVAATSACHMLWFLALAARKGIAITRYEDDAVGHMGPDGDGRTAMTEIILRPRLSFEAGIEPDASVLEALHHDAHEACYIARSLRCPVRVEPV